MDPMRMPNVEEYMTHEPYTVSSSSNLEEARAVMRRYDIRHLPVVVDDELAGLVRATDIDAVAGVPGVSLQHVEVSRVVAPALRVWGRTSLAEVAALMVDRKTDCVVVMGGHGVEGIFTATDALAALGTILQREAA